jgi:polyhydroxyalkanoate synthase
LLGEFAKKDIGSSVAAAASDELGIAKAYMDLYSKMLSDPARLAAFSTNMMIDYMQLWQSSWMKLMGDADFPGRAPAKGDGRFRDDDWSSNFLFDYMKQSYLIASRHIQHAVATRRAFPRIEKKVAFFTRQYVDALSPVQFRAHQSAGAARDGGERRPEPAQGPEQPALRHGEGRHQHDRREGLPARHNVADHPGKVVFQTELMQLIQFEPTTQRGLQDPARDHSALDQQVLHPRPAADKSFIKWALDQGHTVFVLSWVNPTRGWRRWDSRTT